MKHIDVKKINGYPIQTIEDGYGPVYFRQYTVRIPVSLDTSEQVFREFKSNTQKFLPDIVASVENSSKSQNIEIKEKERYVIHLFGPWDAPLEARQVQDRFFEFLTLKTAPEAGRIMYSVEKISNSESIFRIASEARSGRYLFHIMYRYFGMGRFFQRKMWEQVCLNFHNRCLEYAGLEKRKAVPVYSETVSSAGEHSSTTSRKPGQLGI